MIPLYILIALFGPSLAPVFLVEKVISFLLMIRTGCWLIGFLSDVPLVLLEFVFSEFVWAIAIACSLRLFL
jgi:hypothetical protein